MSRKRFKPSYSDEHIKKNLSEIFEYLKEKGLKDTVNVIKEVFENEEKAKHLNNILEGKKHKENIISPTEAAALLIQDGLSKAKYEYLKDLTDSLNLHFLPSWDDVKKERDKCVAKDATFNDDVAHASIYGTLENYLERLELDEDVVNAVLKIKEEYGENVAIQWVLIYKIGFDGSTQKPMKVIHIFFIFFLNFLNCINHTNIFFQSFKVIFQCILN